MRILVIEDDADVRDGVDRALRADGFAVDTADDIEPAEVLLAVNHYDTIVADRMVPGGDTTQLVAALRAESERVPVLFLTARDSVEDRVEGFEIGGDDYLVKPFAMDELIVRVRSLCRRAPGSAALPVLEVGALAIDRSKAEVRKSGVLLPLTGKERCILTQLATEPGVPVTRSSLIEHCWDEHHDPMSNVVDAHVASLRRKLGSPNPVRTVRGVGFVLDVDA
ncbi:MAG: response regulator transcription factor [Actinomycetota bacterium]